MNDFMDGQEISKQHPDTFHVPHEDELDQIETGFYIKVGHNKERFWAQVISIEGEAITARVDNDLIMYHPFKCDDEITVEKRHILDLMDNKV